MTFNCNYKNDAYKLFWIMRSNLPLVNPGRTFYNLCVISSTFYRLEQPPHQTPLLKYHLIAIYISVAGIVVASWNNIVTGNCRVSQTVCPKSHTGMPLTRVSNITISASPTSECAAKFSKKCFQNIYVPISIFPSHTCQSVLIFYLVKYLKMAFKSF